LLFDSNIRGDKNLWLIDLNTLQIENLGAKDGQHPMLSGDGKVFAYQEARYQENLWLHNMQTGTKSLIIASPKYDNNPAYAPDGKSIAFATNKHGYSVIWLYDLALQQQRLLLSIPDKSLLSPPWSPSGEKLLFSAISEQGYQCIELIVKTGLYKHVRDNNTPITSCVYTNEKLILAISKPEEQASQLISLLEYGSNVQLTQNGASRVRLLDDQTYIFSRSDQKGLFQYSEDTQPTKVIIADYPRTFFESWEISNKKLYYIHWVKNDQLWIYEFAKQFHKKVLDSVNVVVGGVISVSPDEAQIVLSEQGNNQGNIFVTELDALN
jgi:Tol biopolymer transport system component